MAVNTISDTSASSQLLQQKLAEQARTVVQASTANADAAKKRHESSDKDSYKQSESVSIQSTEAVKNLNVARSIEQLHKNLNEQAKSVRETMEALTQAISQINDMQAPIQDKIFPPYPDDGSKRQDILMSYISLRKEIQALMVPPPPPPVYEKIKYMWASLFTEDGKIIPSKVPDLTLTSSDQQVKVVGAELGKTNESLASLSSGIIDALLNN